MTDYKRIYEEVWSHEEYRGWNHGLQLWREYRGLFPENFETLLDIGCGTGELVIALLKEGYDAYGIDIAANSVPIDVAPEVFQRIGNYDITTKWYGENVKMIDVGVCCDVMEHIDEIDVPAVLANIWGLCSQVIFVIANHKSEFLGYDLHPTRKPPEWWWRQMLALDPYSRVKFKKIDRPGRDGVFSITWKRG